MTAFPELHCSACDAVAPQGSQHCSRCGLQLTASAARAVYIEGPRFPLWTVLLIAGVALILLLEILGHN